VPAVSALQLLNCGTLSLQQSSSLNVYQPRQFSSLSQDSLFKAGLPVRLMPSFLHLRFGFCWLLWTFINYTYLLTFSFWLTSSLYRSYSRSDWVPQKTNLSGQLKRVFTGQMSFLSPNQQCHSTEWNSKHSLQPGRQLTELHAFMVQQLCPEEMDTTPFMLVLS